MIEVLSNPTVVAAIFTILGGIALKVVEKVIGRKAESRDDRRDFRDEIKDLLERVDRLEEELTEWKDKYYKGQEDILVLKAMIIGAGISIPDNVSDITDPK